MRAKLTRGHKLFLYHVRGRHPASSSFNGHNTTEWIAGVLDSNNSVVARKEVGIGSDRVEDLKKAAYDEFAPRLRAEGFKVTPFKNLDWT